MHVHLKDRVRIDIDCQMEMKTSYWKLTEIERPFIFTAGEFISLTRQAQKNARKMEDDVPVGASALIVKGAAQKLMADFYYKISPPKKPLKVFRDFDKGISWLQSLECYRNLEKVIS